jgi:hypothetical protein
VIRIQLKYRRMWVRFSSGSNQRCLDYVAHPDSYTRDTGDFPGGGGVKCLGYEVKTDGHLIKKLRIRGATRPLPYTFSWRGALSPGPAPYLLFVCIKWPVLVCYSIH